MSRTHCIRWLLICLSAILVLFSSACARQESAPGTAAESSASAEGTPPSPDVAQRVTGRLAGKTDPGSTPVESMGIARKIIRNAQLTLESPDPEEAFRKLASLAESKGGFVVTSDVVQASSDEPAQLVVSMVLRVPASQFDATVEEIRKVATRVVQDKRTGQDVTEEYIDVEARLTAKKALEAQFLEIMKRAARVGDALEVQRQLGEVRTEIEQIEGRKRFLENQADLSTISVLIRPPARITGSASRGFISDLREAIGDGLDIALAMVLVAVRLTLAAIPLALVALPVWLIVRWRRRQARD